MSRFAPIVFAVLAVLAPIASAQSFGDPKPAAVSGRPLVVLRTTGYQFTPPVTYDVYVNPKSVAVISPSGGVALVFAESLDPSQDKALAVANEIIDRNFKNMTWEQPKDERLNGLPVRAYYGKGSHIDNGKPVTAFVDLIKGSDNTWLVFVSMTRDSATDADIAYAKEFFTSFQTSPR